MNIYKYIRKCFYGCGEYLTKRNCQSYCLAGGGGGCLLQPHRTRGCGRGRGR